MKNIRLVDCICTSNTEMLEPLAILPSWYLVYPELCHTKNSLALAVYMHGFPFFFSFLDCMKRSIPRYYERGLNIREEFFLFSDTVP